MEHGEPSNLCNFYLFKDLVFLSLTQQCGLCQKLQLSWHVTKLAHTSRALSYPSAILEKPEERDPPVMLIDFLYRFGFTILDLQIICNPLLNLACARLWLLPLSSCSSFSRRATCFSNAGNFTKMGNV